MCNGNNHSMSSLYVYQFWIVFTDSAMIISTLLISEHMKKLEDILETGNLMHKNLEYFQIFSTAHRYKISNPYNEY